MFNNKRITRLRSVKSICSGLHFRTHTYAHGMRAREFKQTNVIPYRFSLGQRFQHNKPTEMPVIQAKQQQLNDEKENITRMEQAKGEGKKAATTAIHAQEKKSCQTQSV